MGLGCGIGGCGIGPRRRRAASGAAAPESTVSALSDTLYDREYDASITISGTCLNATSVTVQRRVNGGAWGDVYTDAVNPGASDTFTGTLAIGASDVGQLVEFQTLASGPGGTDVVSTNTRSCEITDVRGLVTTYDGVELDVPTSTLTPVGNAAFTNGTFAVDADWTKGTGWSIGSGVATHASGATSIISQDPGQAVGYETECTFTCTSTSGGTGTQMMAGTTAGTLRPDAGTYTEHKTQAGNTTVGFQCNTGTTASIDDASCSSLSVSTLAATKVGSSYGGATWTQATATLVPYVASDRQINGRDVMACTANQDYVNCSLAATAWTHMQRKTSAGTQPEFAVVVVAKCQSLAAESALPVNQAGTNQGASFVVTTAGELQYRNYGAALIYEAKSSATIGVGDTFVASCLADGSNVYVRKNGSQVATVAQSGSTTTNTQLSARLGLCSDVAYLLALKDDCTLAELQMVERFAAHRFGVTLS